MGCICATAFALVGCKGDASLTKYQDNMSAFSDNIAAIDERMNAIDPNSEEAISELLECLEEMDAEFTALAEMEVPKEFAAVESLADEAGSYMTEAVSLYQTVFTTTPYDEYSAMLAEENYKRAMKRKQYISEILQGRIPEGDDITTFYEDDEEPENVPDVQPEESIPDDYEMPTEDLLED